MATYNFYVEIETERAVEADSDELNWAVETAISFSEEASEAFGDGFSVWVSQE